jgi:hypothetical protein
MSAGLGLSRRAASAAADAVTALLDGGYLQLFDGIKPARADAPPGRSVLLCELHFARPAFRPASDGIAQSNPVPPAAATAYGEARWFRCLSAALEPVLDGSIGAVGSGADMTLSSSTIPAGVLVDLERVTYTHPRTTP